MSSSSGKSSSKRNFVLTDSSIGYKGGKYSSNKSGTPLSAAQRAASVLFRMAQNKGAKPEYKKYESSNELIKFTIRESTQGSEKKEYQYEAKIKHLHGSDVKVVKRGNVEYTVSQRITVRAAHYTPMPYGGAESN